ncbi:hypothetical protein [Nocardioides sp. SYSU D00038]|uniref:hypothetical protein n=1 Tax=Nocardioides sp. SYSU D00038 TaxID=2812554 RepID=UPI00196764A3|nr:hypothetical protein [Nocardioides sp. SYSU D00038]
MTVRLEQFPETLALVTLPVGAEVPAWAEASSLLSVTVTATETSLVCAARSVPTKVRGRRPLTAFTCSEETGSATALADLLVPLAEDGLAATVVTTLQAVWVLVPVAEAERAAEAWRRRGHEVAPAVPVQPAKPATPRADQPRKKNKKR